ALRLCCGLTHRVLGKENLPEPPYVIYSKHQSAWETIAFSCIFPPTSFVAKRELLMIPCFGWGFAVMSPITIDRGSPRKALRAVLDQGKRRLDQGFCVCVYPEGSRIEPGRTARFAASGVQLAAEAGVPVVPVALDSGRFWINGSWRKQPGRITVSIGKQQQPQRDRIRETVDALHEWIAAETSAIGG
ncbi:MAG: lysophospholipid acyltransferase family protein, partial [Betaproteobacteria bacterium]|nr:lysophospholipid acyltransferase family protein [Betaproteobacteria bacterium]